MLLVVGALACEQDEGEPCQVNRDCAPGLECVKSAGVERATCEPIGASDDSDDVDAGADSGSPDNGDASAMQDDASAMGDASAAQDGSASEDASAMGDASAMEQDAAAAQDAATEDAAADEDAGG